MIQLVRKKSALKGEDIQEPCLDAINESDFQGVLREYCHENDAMHWKPLSIVRYSSVIANRGIIKSKGFFIYAQR